jgi:hypothetical protein
MSMSGKDRSKRELAEAVAKVRHEGTPQQPAPRNPALEDSQARGGAEMAAEEGRARPRDRDRDPG